MSSEMRELIRKEVEQWVGITRNRDIERSARVWMEGYDAALTYCAERISALLARTEAGAVEKRAPVQRYHGKTIPWRVHGLAWEAYAKKYGSSQSAERIAERGGFGVGEMDEFLPGWREMAEGTHPQDASGDAEKDAEIARLNAIINSPQSDDFLRAVSTEAEHQRQRWGSDHDAGKTPADWFWLVGYLGGKALHSQAAGDTDKAEHHIITTAAACANWHRAMFGRTDMRPGIDGQAAMQAKEAK